MVSLVNPHSNATSRRWHLWEIDLRFSPGLPPGWWRVRAYVGVVINDTVRHARVLSNQPKPYPPNRRPILPTDTLSTQPTPYPHNRHPILSTDGISSKCRVGAYVAVVIDDAVRHARVLSNQPTPYPPNRRPILPTDTLSTQPTPYPPNRHPILPTDTLSSQPTPYSTNRRPILTTDALFS